MLVIIILLSIIDVFVKLVEYIDVWVFDLTHTLYYTCMRDLTSNQTDTSE